jgi:Calx-beta domain
MHALASRLCLPVCLAGFWIAGALCAGAAQAQSGSVALSSASYSVAVSAGSVTVSVTRTGGSVGAASVEFITVPGTAAHGVNYASVQGYLNWASGDASAKSITVTIFGQPFSGTKTFSIQLYNSTGTAIGSPSSAVVSIAGTTTPSTAAFSAPSYTVAAGPGSVSLSVQRSGDTSGAASVEYITVPGTASHGVDYASVQGYVTWAAGDGAAKTITVPIFGQIFSGSRTFSVQLYNASGTSLATPSSASVTITGNSSPGSVALAQASYSVASNAGSVSISVQRTGNASGAASVEYLTIPGTAVHGVDYASMQGYLNWASGDTSPKSFAVGIFNHNQTATFGVQIYNPSGAVVGTPAQATVTITGTTPPTATLTASPSSVASGSSSTLTWSSTNATACSASSGWSGTLATSGSASTGPLTATTTYGLVCTGPAGSSNVATTSVTVTSNLSVSPHIAAITFNQSKQFTATVPGGGTVTWSVDGINNGNSTVGAISSGGLYSAGTAAGVHTVAATSAANPAQSAASTVAVTDLPGVYTYHNDLARDGQNTHEYALTTASVSSGGFGKIASCTVDGAIYAQPLWAANLKVNGAMHNVVYAATQHDSVYAFDADASPCSLLWSASLIDAGHGGAAGETSVPYTLVGNGASGGDIQPEVGITGTPVIDSANGILYVVTKSIDSTQKVFYQRLHAIDLATGLEKLGSPVLITATYPGTGAGGTTVAFDPHMELQRTGLALLNGLVYIAWAAHEDHAPWYGWVMSYQYAGSALTQQAVLNVAPNTQDGGIWGSTPSADANNNLYVVTGNGTFDATNTSPPNNDYGDSLLKLTPSLAVSNWFAPSDELNDGQKDADFGAGGAALLANLPDGNTVIHALICGGKDGHLYVLNTGMLGFGDGLAVQIISLGHGIFSTGAVWNNQLYLAALNGPLNAYTLNTSNAQFTLSSQSINVYGFPGATPSVSSSGTQNGIVWTLETESYCTHKSASCGPAILHAHDAGNVATEIWNSAANAADAAGYPVKFTVPTVANGRVYVGTRGNNIGGIDSSTSTPGELDIYGFSP